MIYLSSCFLSIRDLTEDVFPDGTKPRFDATGTFFWCERRSFQAVVMVLTTLIPLNDTNKLV